MMTGQLIAGASVMNAVKSQQIIMFLISGAAAFGTLSSVLVSELYTLLSLPLFL
jgi:ABC-type iron transport system FetAB permease component